MYTLEQHRIIDEDVSFFHFLHKIMNIWSWRCFSSSKIRTQFSHTFYNIIMIFKVMSQYFPAFLNLHQTVTRFGCVGFSMYACGFFVPQMRQVCLVTYPPRSKWASSEKKIFFAKIGIFCKSCDRLTEKRRWINVDGASNTLSATAGILSGVRTVFIFSGFGS